MDSFERIVAPLAADAETRLTADPGAANAAFLVALCGPRHPAHERAERVLSQPGGEFFRAALERVRHEVERVSAAEPEIAGELRRAAASLASGDGRPNAAALWPVFFPEGVGILGNEQARVEELRARRTVSVEQLNERPIADPSAELLFTSNVLLTVPAAETDVAALPYDDELKAALGTVSGEPQLYWYDHPIQIGVEPAANELLYGLRALDRAVGYERQRDPRLGRLRVVLSASVTHAGLRPIARDYVRHELAREGRLENLSVHLFTEDDTRALVEAVLAPLVESGGGDAGALAQAFGVDGEYGVHYSFLKAIAALWAVAVDPTVRGTFKIDLDQVFVQPQLVEQTGASAFGHLCSALWGARGRDARGEAVELGMIAGALVNERDAERGLFTPDVPFPAGPRTRDEHVFFSKLPQALSTEAEMMARYDAAALDGRTACLERIHVTGGTNGILVDALRRHRPFTPSFIGRAEDQAYILSVLDRRPRLAYAHEAGLIMRHDKESFAGAAIEAARVGKLVGDDVRILYFSAYAELLGREPVKSLIDPFTGCFVSRLPATVVLLRLALRIDEALAAGDTALAAELLALGPRRLEQALSFTAERARFAAAVERERAAWDAYYDALERLETGLAGGEPWALELAERARGLVDRTLLE